MSSATSAVTYTFIYTDSEPDRAFWRTDQEEVSEGGIPRVIILGYDGLPLQPVAPPSPDYIPGPKGPQTPPIPQDEDDHEFSAEEQPLPPIDSPTAESPRHVTESDPEEDPEEYEDDETEDGLVDYPMDGGDDGDDEDGDSSGDDANEEDEDEEDKEDDEEEEHLAPADSTTVIPADEPDYVDPRTSISRLQRQRLRDFWDHDYTTPSPPISLSPPFAERLLVMRSERVSSARPTTRTRDKILDLLAQEMLRSDNGLEMLELAELNEETDMMVEAEAMLPERVEYGWWKRRNVIPERLGLTR
ncbi:hypothetical protein Tco_0631705 [Tanacetum coccineum]